MSMLLDPMNESLSVRKPDAMDRLFQQERPLLYGFIFRLVRDPEETQNLVQETFLQAFQCMDTFQGRSKFSTWLCAIAKNVVFLSFRKTRRYKVYSEEELDRLPARFNVSGLPTGAYTAWDPEALVEENEWARIVRAAIDRLSEKDRAIITLRVMEEFSTGEAARVLRISEGNARVRLHRARNALRKLLEPYFTD